MLERLCLAALAALSEDCAETSPFLGREKELSALRDAWSQLMGSGRSVFVHVSGRPGAGKTAAVRRVQQEMSARKRAKTAASSASTSSGGVRSTAMPLVHWINCTHVRSVLEVYELIWRSFFPAQRSAASQERRQGGAPSSVELVDLIDGLVAVGAGAGAARPLVLVADEVHELARRFPDALAQLAVWQARPGSRLSVIGISNALNTVDCFAAIDQVISRSAGPGSSVDDDAPASSSSSAVPGPGLPPSPAPSASVRVHFEPYSADSILAAIRSRLDAASAPPPATPTSSSDSAAAAATLPPLADLFEPAALKFCSLKVAKAGGDMRRAFEMLTRAIAVFQQESLVGAKTKAARAKDEKENAAVAAAVAGPAASASVSEDSRGLGGAAPAKISVSHVAGAARDAAAPDSKVRIAEMPVPHKHLLCAIVLAFSAAAAAPPPTSSGRRKYGPTGGAALGQKRRRAPSKLKGDSAGVPFLKVYGQFLALNAKMGVPPAQRCSRDNLFIMCQAMAEARSLIELKRDNTPAQSVVLLCVPLDTIKQALAQDAIYRNVF